MFVAQLAPICVHNNLPAVASCRYHCRYQEIAEHAFGVIQQRAVSEGGQKQRLRHAPQPLNVLIAQEVYRVLLFSAFLAQVVVVRHIPYIGELSCLKRHHEHVCSTCQGNADQPCSVETALSCWSTICTCFLVLWLQSSPLSSTAIV